MNNEKGFTLMETMMAMIIFAIGLLMVAAVLPLSMGSVTHSASHTRASELAAERAEAAIRSYASPENDPGMHLDPASHDGYYVAWKVEDNNPEWFCKRVTITVTKPSDPALNTRLVCVTTRGSL